MEALQDRIQNAEASKIAGEPVEMVFFALKGVNTRAAIQNLRVYRDI